MTINCITCQNKIERDVEMKLTDKHYFDSKPRYTYTCPVCQTTIQLDFDETKISGCIDWEMYDRITASCRALGVSKNLQYGTASLKLFDGQAILMRINDKVARINMLGVQPYYQDSPVDESIEDTLMDLVNYTIYLMILRQGGIS